MRYPCEILPNRYYKDICCNVDSHLLIRHIDLLTENERNELLDDGTQQIKLKYICNPSANLADLSTSLLGIFVPHHTNIELTKQGKIVYSHECSPNENVSRPKYKEHYNWTNMRHYWWCCIQNINGKTIDITYNKIVYKAECRIEHTPMKWNYWHYSFRWYIQGIGYWHEMTDLKLKGKLAEKIGHEGKSMMKIFCKVTVPNFPSIDISCYKCSFKERVIIFFKYLFGRK